MTGLNLYGKLFWSHGIPNLYVHDTSMTATSICIDINDMMV